ncbi:hypothetical protein GTO91_02965 [Heliobacterium undosum]|uniref:Uncharacterized protein n=1 Tax=Heliomicrobium undosum TaxID=121734 RepID=A0A845L2F7_9FIRM|nr:hypothetical protein [Heliomicrobium undosum]MZP28680.1 hypothetical protein [Heliomicrobium undosum]
MITEYVVENGSVYKVEREGGCLLSKSFFCPEIQLHVTSLKSGVRAGEAMPVTVELRSWKNTPLSDAAVLTVQVDLEGENPVVLNLDMVNGKAEFDFVAEAAGKYRVFVQAQNTVSEPMSFEVEVS